MNNKHRDLWILVIGLALLIALGSVTCVGIAFLLPTLLSENGAFLGFLLAGGALLSLGMVLALCFAGWRGYRGIPSQRFYPQLASRSGRGWMLFLILIGLGAFVIALLFPPALQMTPLFAPFHLAVIVLPALLLFSLAVLGSGRKQAPTIRQFILTLSGGALSTFLALPLEMLGGLLSIIVVVIIAAGFPAGQAEVERLMSLWEQWMNTARTSGTMDKAMMEMASKTLLTSPVVLGTLALTLGLATPLIEEFGKTLVMGIAGIWQKPRLSRAFLWGAACGLGFAMVEGFTNGSMGLGELGGWFAGVVARMAATAMHAFTSGLLGLGWGYFWQKRWWMLPLTYLAAVMFHGLWNFNVVVMLGSAGALMSSSSPFAGLLPLLGVGLQLLLAVVSPVGVIGIPLLLRKYESHDLGIATPSELLVEGEE